MRKKSRLFLFIVIFLAFTMLIPSISMAGDPTEDPNFFKPNPITNGDVSAISNKANQIVGVIVTVGTVISVITLVILGIKYMMGSVEEKAEYKKSMIPYLIGAVLLFAGSAIVQIIASLVQDTNLVK